MDISFIIVSWNTRQLTLQCLRSVYETVKGCEFEVLVVDNGSTDGSPEAIAEEFPQVKLIRNAENAGFAKACNKALRTTSARYVILLNSDARLCEDAVARLKQFMDENDDVAAVGGQLINEDGSRQNSVANFPTLATELLNKTLLRLVFPKRYPGKYVTYDTPIDVESVIGACMMVRQEAIAQVGLLDEDYFFFLEETDWCYRMRRAGWRVCHVPMAQIYHVLGGSAERIRWRSRIEYYRSRYLFFRKNRGTAQWMALHAGVFLRLIWNSVTTLLMVILTAFCVQRPRKRLTAYLQLLLWHVRLCPETDRTTHQGGEEND